MSSPKKSEATLHKRLIPLYIAVFFHGFVLWYATEKLFMKTIGFNDASIGLMIAFYSAVTLIADTPSGLLADRWSRKGVLMLASVALALSAIVGGVSHSVPLYLFSAGLWGLFFALYSGAYESITYDTVLEETNSSSRYEHYLGQVKIAESIALVLGSILGGLAANYFGLRSAYFITVPFSLLAILALTKFEEPQLHKLKVADSIPVHVRNTFKAVTKKGQLVPIMVVLVTISTLEFTVFEFSQLWTITLAAPIVLFGPINAIYLSTIGTGGAIASRFKLHKYSVMTSALVLMVLASLGMIFSRNLFITVVCITLLCVCFIGLNVVFTKLLHDSLDSKVRAGAASAVSTFGRMIIIPVALVFGYVSNEIDVFHASWLIAGLVLVIVVFVNKTYTNEKVLPVITHDDELQPASYNK